MRYEIDGPAFTASVGDQRFEGRVLDASEPDGVRLEIEGISMCFRVHRRERDPLRQLGGGSDRVRGAAPVPVGLVRGRSTGGLVAPVPGRVITVEVSVGDVVTRG